MTDANAKEPLKSALYASSHDDKYGVQRNWFTALYKQLNYFAKTGTVSSIKGRQKQVFEGVEREFEALYERHILGKGLAEDAHRAMLLLCLSIATYRVLNDEFDDAVLVREVIRTNLGSLMMGVLLPLHRARIWVLKNLLGEGAYDQAVKFLPALQQDMGPLCTSSIQTGEGEATLTVTGCKYHEVCTAEDTPFLLSEFCCHHGLVWMHEFRKHGVAVGLDSCMAWEDEGCCLRQAAAGQQAPGGRKEHGNHE